MSEEKNFINEAIPEDDFMNAPREDSEFGANKELEIEVCDTDKLKEDYQELNDKYTRICADFVNFRNRTKNQTQEIEDFATVSVLKQFLPLFDSFNSMSFENASKESLQEGLISLKNQLIHILDKIGVEEIYTDEGFNNKYHEAVTIVKNEEKEDGDISKIYIKGYKYKNKVLRPTVVEVVKNEE